MLPVRFVAESLGATVAWDGASSTATISDGGVEIKITIGAAAATVNGVERRSTRRPLLRIQEPICLYGLSQRRSARMWNGTAPSSIATITK